MTDRDTWWDSDQERDDYLDRVEDEDRLRASFPNLSKSVKPRESDEYPTAGGSDHARTGSRRRK